MLEVRAFSTESRDSETVSEGDQTALMQHAEGNVKISKDEVIGCTDSGLLTASISLQRIVRGNWLRCEGRGLFTCKSHAHSEEQQGELPETEDQGLQRKFSSMIEKHICMFASMKKPHSFDQGR